MNGGKASSTFNGVLETVLYVDDLERACAFYEEVLGLAGIYTDQRLRAYDVGGRGVPLLLSAAANPCRP